MWQFKYEGKGIQSSKMISKKTFQGFSKMSRKNEIP